MRKRHIAAAVILAQAIVGCIDLPEPSWSAYDQQSASSGWKEATVNWTNGTQLTWKGETYSAEPSDEWATDGWTYLYGRKVGEGRTTEECRSQDPPQHNLTYVFIRQYDDGRCHWAEHPSTACATASFCTRVIHPAGPPPTPP